MTHKCINCGWPGLTWTGHDEVGAGCPVWAFQAPYFFLPCSISKRVIR